jgi:hypothetical protein
VVVANGSRIGMTTHDRSLAWPFRKREYNEIRFRIHNVLEGWHSVRSAHKSCVRDLMCYVLEIIPNAWSLHWISLYAKLLTLKCVDFQDFMVYTTH